MTRRRKGDESGERRPLPLAAAPLQNAVALSLEASSHKQLPTTPRARGPCILTTRVATSQLLDPCNSTRADDPNDESLRSSETEGSNRGCLFLSPRRAQPARSASPQATPHKHAQRCCPACARRRQRRAAGPPRPRRPPCHRRRPPPLRSPAAGAVAGAAPPPRSCLAAAPPPQAVGPCSARRAQCLQEAPGPAAATLATTSCRHPRPQPPPPPPPSPPPRPRPSPSKTPASS